MSSLNHVRAGDFLKNQNLSITNLFHLIDQRKINVVGLVGREGEDGMIRWWQQATNASEALLCAIGMGLKYVELDFIDPEICGDEPEIVTRKYKLENMMLDGDSPYLRSIATTDGPLAKQPGKVDVIVDLVSLRIKWLTTEISISRLACDSIILIHDRTYNNPIGVKNDVLMKHLDLQNSGYDSVKKLFRSKELTHVFNRFIKKSQHGYYLFRHEKYNLVVESDSRSEKSEQRSGRFQPTNLTSIHQQFAGGECPP